MRDEYTESLELHNAFFYSLIMAAMRKAVPGNLKKLQREWPDVWVELELRDKAVDGILTGSDATRFGA